MNEAVLDRLSTLRAAGPEALADLVGAVPVFADLVIGLGPLSRVDSYGYLRSAPLELGSVESLARYLAGPVGIELTILSLDRIAYQVLVIAVWRGEAATRDEIRRFAPGLDRDALDAAVQSLRVRLLVDERDDGVVRARPGVGEQLRMPGVTARSWVQHARSDEIAEALAGLGIRPPRLLAERVAAYLEALADPEVVGRTYALLSADARALLDRLLRYDELPLVEAGLTYFTPHSLRRMNTPFAELYNAGLVGAEPYGEFCWAWLDVKASLTGSIFESWIAAAPVQPRALNSVGNDGVPGAVRLLDRVIARWKVAPPKGLKAGGIGVSAVRAVAKHLGTSPGEVGLVVTLAVGLGLFEEEVVARRGRGRKQTVDTVWQPSKVWHRFAALDARARLRVLVQAWADSVELAGGPDLPERYSRSSIDLRACLVRRNALQILSELPDGFGFDDDDLESALLGQLGGSYGPGEAASIVAAGRLLGLFPPAGVVGLTAHGRALLSGAPAPVAHGAMADRFVVQADHTVIVPPDLEPDVELTLDAFAELESGGGARVYRLTERSIAAAIDHGMTGTEIERFLVAHSSVPVAPNVLRTVVDTANRHGVLRVGSAASWVSTDDPVALAAAVKVKAAKLLQLDATTAVSPLTEVELTAALRKRGLSPESEAELAARVTAAIQLDAAGDADASEFDLRDAIIPGAASIARAIEAIYAGRDDEPAISTRRPGGIADPEIQQIVHGLRQSGRLIDASDLDRLVSMGIDDLSLLDLDFDLDHLGFDWPDDD